ncbi:Velvet factor-domain containing protein [Rhodotorula toruloides]|nr:Velvet factor-domain containing protein [Rhodotorula toruloides]
MAAQAHHAMVPPPDRPPAAAQTSPRASMYALDVRQQPRQARMAGSGEKADRRPIDPPPIIRLRVRRPSARKKPAHLLTDDDLTTPTLTHTLFMFAALVSEDGEEEVDEAAGCKNALVAGTVVSSLFHLRDESCFVFPDLSIRTEGRWRFKMSLYELTEDGVRFCSSVLTDVFQVYSSKRFPGMSKSTELSKSFAQQGIKLRVRRPGSRLDDDAPEEPPVGPRREPPLIAKAPARRVSATMAAPAPRRPSAPASSASAKGAPFDSSARKRPWSSFDAANDTRLSRPAPPPPHPHGLHGPAERWRYVPPNPNARRVHSESFHPHDYRAHGAPPPTYPHSGVMTAPQSLAFTAPDPRLPPNTHPRPFAFTTPAPPRPLDPTRTNAYPAHPHAHAHAHMYPPHHRPVSPPPVLPPLRNLLHPSTRLRALSSSPPTSNPKPASQQQPSPESDFDAAEALSFMRSGRVDSLARPVPVKPGAGGPPAPEQEKAESEGSRPSTATGGSLAKLLGEGSSTAKGAGEVFFM